MSKEELVEYLESVIIQTNITFEELVDDIWSDYKSIYQQGRADTQTDILNILHSIDRQVEQMVREIIGAEE